MMMSGGGHPAGGGYLQLIFSSVSSSQHQSRGFAAAFQFITGLYRVSRKISPLAFFADFSEMC